MKIAPNINFTGVVQTTVGWLNSFVQSWKNQYQNLAQAFNGHIGFGDGTDSDNIDGNWVTVTTPVASGTDFTVDHNLGRLPAGYIQMRSDKASSVYDGTIAATPNQITLQSTASSATIKLFVFLLLFCVAPLANAQGYFYHDIALYNSSGNARVVASPLITVCLGVQTVTPCAGPTAIYSCQAVDLTCPQQNPFNGDFNGNFGFWVTASTTYTVTISGAGVNSYNFYFVAPTVIGGASSFATITSTSPAPALSGFIRMATTDQICWRNASNTADLCLNKNGADNLFFGTNQFAFLNANGAFTGNITAGTFNRILYVDGVQFPTLASAVAACGASCWIIDTLPETFSGNAFTGFVGFAKIEFGAGVWTVNAQQIIPAGVSSFKGAGRVGTGNTLFKAGAGLPVSTPLFKSLGTQGQVFSQFAIDCNLKSGSTGMLATDWNENSGVDGLLVINCPVTGINVDGSSFTSIPAQNYFVRNLEVFPGAAGGGATVGLNLKGNGGGGPGEVSNVTANGAAGHIILAGVQATNWNQGRLANIHGEWATNVFLIPAIGISAFLVNQITGSNTDTNVVNIDAGSSANSFLFTNIGTNAGPVTMLDGPRGISLTDQFIPFYEIGGGAVGAQDIYTSSNNIPKHFSTGFSLPQTLKNVNYTLLKTDSIVNLTVGTTTLTVPHALVGQVWFVRNVRGTGVITVSCDSGLINGLATVPLDNETGSIIYADGTNCFANNDSTKRSTGDLGGVGCTTGASSFNTCTNVITISPTQQDTNYIPICVGLTPSDARALIQTAAATSTTTVTCTTVTEGSVAVSFGDIKVVAIHP